jgi:uncharacterized membrane protein
MTAISPQSFVATATNFSLLLPLSLACCAVITAIPVSAVRGRLHIPGYVGLALLTFVFGLLAGKLSGARGITGTNFGVALSLLFFFLIAVALGCILALFFYRDPPEA